MNHDGTNHAVDSQDPDDRGYLVYAHVFIRVFGMEGSWTQKLTGFLIHSIPVLVLALITVLAFIKELPGGILIVIATVIMMVRFNAFTSNKGALIMFIPFLIAGLLFIISYSLSRVVSNKQKK